MYFDFQTAMRLGAGCNLFTINYFRVYNSPPEMVRKVMEAVCVLLKEKNTWSSAKQLLGDPGLLKRLTYFDKDNIPLKVGMYIIYFKSRYFAPYLFKKDKRHWRHWRHVIPSIIDFC